MADEFKVGDAVEVGIYQGADEPEEWVPGKVVGRLDACLRVKVDAPDHKHHGRVITADPQHYRKPRAEPSADDLDAAAEESRIKDGTAL